MGISKIYVNNNLKIDLTKTTATAEDVAAGKEFYNKQGDLVQGSFQVPEPVIEPAWFNFDAQNKKIILHLEDKSLDVPELIRDQWECCGHLSSDYYTYEIYINKNSYIPNYTCYFIGGNCNRVHFICTEPMTFEDVWSCLEDPSLYSSSGAWQGPWIPGIDGIYNSAGEPIIDTEVTLPNWTWIPPYTIQIGFSSTGINKVILPAEVEFVATIGYQVNILKCLRKTPPEIYSEALQEARYIEVPAGCKDAYTGADVWRYYASRIYEDGESLPEV